MIPGRAIATPIDAPQAGLARRLAASLYEGLLLGALALAIGFALLPLLGQEAAAGNGPLPLPGPSGRALLLACLFGAWGAYCVWLWSGDRRSLPMRTWGVALRTAPGGSVSALRAAIRYLAWWIAPLCAIAAYLALRPYGQSRWAAALPALNYAWAVIDPDGRFLPDRLAGLRLVREAVPRSNVAVTRPPPA